MSTYGSAIKCPACGAEHVVRVGEISNQRRIEFTCNSCGVDAIVDNEISEPAVHKKGRWDK